MVDALRIGLSFGFLNAVRSAGLGDAYPRSDMADCRNMSRPICRNEFSRIDVCTQHVLYVILFSRKPMIHTQVGLLNKSIHHGSDSLSERSFLLLACVYHIYRCMYDASCVKALIVEVHSP